MTWNFGDSFDLYANMSDAAFGYWDTFSAGTPAAGRFTNSRAWTYSFTIGATKASNVNDQVHHFVFSTRVDSTPSAGAQMGFTITLYDGATAQCTIGFQQDGSVLLRQGLSSGAIIATWPGAITVANTWYAFEFEVVVSATNGGMTIRKNGNTSNDFTISGLNTQATANAYANKIAIAGASNSMTGSLDDFFWRSGASVAWMGDIRCYARMPATDVQAQFSHTTTQWTYPIWGNVGIPNAFGANLATYMRFIPAANGSVVGFSFSSSAGSGGTGHLKAALFADNGGAIGAVLATSSEVVNPGAATITCVFPTPGHITAGVAYWIGINQDASLNYSVINSGSVAPPSGPVTAAINLTTTPYASWPVSNPGGTPSAFNIPGAGTFLLIPSQNADAVSDTQQDGLITYVYDNNPGDADFYSVGPIPSTPAVVFATVVRGFMTKSDAGSRTATMQLRSGGATVAAPALTLTTSSWLWCYRVDTVDPATGAAWTPSGVNAAQIGPKVLT